MSGNDYSRCEQCGAVWLDNPKPCDCESVEDALREALKAVMCDIANMNEGLPCRAETWDKCYDALKETT